MIVLVTGGAGYLGSHVCLELINEGYDIITFDNYSNSTDAQLKIIEERKKIKIIQIKGDITCRNTVKKVFSQHSIDAVIHLAGLKSVPDAEINPLKYYETNVLGTINLLSAINTQSCKKFVFSSSATVYGKPHYLPMDEKHPREPENVYGRSKLYSERIIQDFCKAQNQTMKALSLRYFNPIGASPECNIGENSKNTTNIMPMLLLTASRKKDYLEVFGHNYNTKDGTAGRDYIHVSDLAKAHVKSLQYEKKKYDVFNVGTGKFYSVIELISTFEKVNNIKIPYKFVDKRKGDISIYFASVSKVNKELGWVANFTLEEMCRDAWQYYKYNKNFLNV